ncbi:hypothetical protein BDQ94DRAFT_152746 [Aspergillus welwitschiae]|uniref:Uncharacterized protein n=1 Tax=Aspergillus welwitschiae TaxID=1341132 RepID=A0A3F3PMP5_9EURO|nr:hypothetical protein BDQ94DRAFT_152746 [Aspergillus welwitschiae]RDH28197.1 hypothetical protein BDQ94DRAFT_152746 [Aspergillus welwitschiae]
MKNIYFLPEPRAFPRSRIRCKIRRKYWPYKVEAFQPCSQRVHFLLGDPSERNLDWILITSSSGPAFFVETPLFSPWFHGNCPCFLLFHDPCRVESRNASRMCDDIVTVFPCMFIKRLNYPIDIRISPRNPRFRSHSRIITTQFRLYKIIMAGSRS